MSELCLFIYLFALFSLVGWLLEVVCRSARKKRFVNPGFLSGPYLPIYGASVLALTICIIHVNDGFLESSVADLVAKALPFLHEKTGPVVVMGLVILLKAVLYSFVTTGVEFATGLVSRRFLKRRLWDYSGEFLSIGGSVCLKYSCLWIGLAFLYEYAVLPAALRLGLLVDPSLVLALSSGVCTAILLDFFQRAKEAFKNARTLSMAKRQESYREFYEIVSPLLQKEEIRRLGDFKHHLSKTRLDHSLDVAWLSYSVARRLSWDRASAARGGLLHDLFHYDWATEGPRLHGFRHPRICLGNAERLFDLNEREKDIIKKHMWPLTVIPPRYPESWSVCLADTFCGAIDYAEAFRHLRKTVNEG